MILTFFYQNDTVGRPVPAGTAGEVGSQCGQAGAVHCGKSGNLER